MALALWSVISHQKGQFCRHMIDDASEITSKYSSHQVLNCGWRRLWVNTLASAANAIVIITFHLDFTRATKLFAQHDLKVWPPHINAA
jgi:hypothetical protein